MNLAALFQQAAQVAGTAQASASQAAGAAASTPAVATTATGVPSTAAEVVARSGELLPQASNFAPAIDDSFLTILWFATFLSIALAGTFALLAWRGSRADAELDEPGQSTGTSRSFARWAAAGSALLALAFFVQGAWVRADMEVAPRNALPIKVALGEQGFTFTYPNGYATGELHLPLDRAVRFVFAGASEPYSFSLPELRLSVSVPIATARNAWVQPTLAGEYTARSTTPLARPRRIAAAAPTTPVGAATVSPFAAPTAVAIVHPAGGYEKWYQDISGPPLDLPPLELGQRSYQMRGCTQCHTVDGTKSVGPSFLGFATREHRMKDGSVVDPSDDYVKESVLDPQAKVVEGFEPVMPSFRGRLHELEIAGLAAYIKSLQ